MDKNTKIILEFLVILTGRVLSIEDTHAQILKCLAELPEADDPVRQRFNDIAAKIESGHEQLEALLAAVKAALGM